MNNLSTLQILIVWALPVLFAVTVHEVAHGWMARRLGDPTAQMLGRLTLNPIKHIDPVGTILVPGLLLLFNTGFIFGWAKPVPITWQNLKNPKRDMALVAAAGPGANLLMMFGWLAVARLGLALVPVIPWAAKPLFYMGEAGIFVNGILMIINLVPVPPLDGSRIVSAVLPPRLALKYNRIEPYGLIILLVLLATGLLGRFLSPVMSEFQHLVYYLLNF